MKTFGTILGIFFSLALLLALLAGGYLVFRYVVDLFGALESQMATMTAIAAVVAVLCAGIIAHGLKWRSQKEQETRIRGEKAKIYERLLSLWAEKFKGQEVGENPLPEDELGKLEQLLALQAPVKVIATYAELQRLAKQEGGKGDDLSGPLARLVTEMRKDLGLGVLNLRDRDVLGLLLSRP